MARSLGFGPLCSFLVIPVFLLGCGGSNSPIAISVSQASPKSVDQGESSTVAATLENDSSGKGVNWSLSCSTPPCGSILPANTLSGAPASYTAPSPVAANLTVTLTATSVKDLTKSASTTLTVVPAPSVSSTSLPNGSLGVPYSQSVQATGGIPPYTWSLPAGTTPPFGLTLNSDGTLTGTPNVTGNSTLTPQVTDSGSPPLSTTGNVNISVNNGPLAVTTGSLADGSVDNAYSQNLQATGGLPPYTWTVSGGTLPNWATLISSGSIRGIPGATGSTNFTVQVADSDAQALTATQSLSITVNTGSSSNVSELKGHYAFFFSGYDDSSSSPLVIAGSFIADGAGKITGGIEDENGGASPPLNVSFTGTYNIDSNHRGAFTLTTTSDSKTFSCSLGSISGGVASKGRFVQFDDVSGTSGQRGSGVLRLQDPSAFTLAAINGPYAFGFSGHDASGKREIRAGRLDANGTGTIVNGLEDLNDNTVVTNSVAFTGSYTAPSASNGRTTFSLTPADDSALNLSAYVVSAHEIFALSSDAISSGLAGGLLLSQFSTSFVNASLSDSSVFYSVGVNDTIGSTAEIGLFTSDGAGNLAEVYDRNNAGSLGLNQSVSGQTYVVSSDGRVLLSGGEPFILYLVDTNKAFLLDQSANAGLGFVQPQATAPPAGFDNTSVSGTLTAATISPTIVQNSNEVGLATLDGAGAFQTVEDVSNQTSLVLNELTTGNYTISANGRGIVTGFNITLAGFGLWMFPLLIAAWLWFTPRKATRSKPRPNFAMFCFTAWVAAVPSACPRPKINELVFYVVSPTDAVMIHLQSADAAPVVAIFEP